MPLLFFGTFRRVLCQTLVFCLVGSNCLCLVLDEDAVGELKRAARPVTSPEAFDVRADARDE